ncbi:MAG: GntR family transcriptional regulator [Deltaproteobacteria bacterium]|nr:GntR family transcriptional regulator [Deltaproteobacteria bacterium]
MGSQKNISRGLEDLAKIGERKSLGQHVFENLKGAIVKGDIPPGGRLIESRLAETLGISRTPVREAIHKLEREGYLRKLSRGGFSVLGLSREDVEETFGIRGVLESYAARLAAQNHRKTDLKPLEKKIKLYQKHLDCKDLDALPDINTEFHDLLYALSRSPKLIHMINNLRDQIYRFRQLILRDEKMAKMSNEDHKDMLERIRRRDADGVERLVRDHLRRGKKAVMDSYDELQ